MKVCKWFNPLFQRLLGTVCPFLNESKYEVRLKTNFIWYLGLTVYWIKWFFSIILEVKVKSLSLVWLFATPWTVAHQAPPSMEFSRKEYWMHACMLSHFSCVQLYATLWTAAHQAPLSMGFSRQEYWSVLPFPSPGDLPNPGLNRSLLHWQVDSLPLSHQGSSRLFLKYPLLSTGILVIIHFKIFMEGKISLFNVTQK